jgi:hypothetical protein
MKLSEPIHEVLSIFVRDFLLEVSVRQEVRGVHVSIFFLAHIFHYLGHELNNSLWVPDLQHVIEVKLGLVVSKPVLSPQFHFLRDGLKLLVIKLV